MGDSLQDQLRALGLAGKAQAERKGRKQGGQAGTLSARRPNPATDPATDPAPESPPAGELSLDQAYALRQQEEQRQAQQARERKLAEERHRREINRRMGEIIGAHRLNREDAEIARNFMFRGRIRKVYVTPAQQQALNEERLGIVYLGGGYHLLAPEHLAAARAIDSGLVVDTGGPEADETEFPVPEDLVW